jgi:neutral ceramidase
MNRLAVRFFHAVFVALVALIALTTTSCGGQAPAPRAALRYQAPVEGYLAATRVADITPPIHLSLFGHGPESRVSTGVRLRLRCEVFVIAQGPEVVALVPCDLQSSSEALQRRVTDLLAAAKVPIGPDRLFIMATHSHMAPAHYFDANRYSGPFSSMAPGFDEKVLNFLAGRIATPIIDAFRDLKPACIGWQQDDIADAELGMNRSYVPYLANVPLAGSVPEPARTKNTSRGSELAVDSVLSVLRVDRRDAALSCAGSRPIGALAVYGLHPTGMPNTNSLYHGDIFGYAVRAAEGAAFRRLEPANPDLAWAAESAPPSAACDANPGACERFVVGLANGIDGDVSPRIYEQSDGEARRVGRVLGGRIDAASTAAAAHLAPAGTVERMYRELWFPGARYDDDATHLLCPTGELGAVSAGGARDGPTRVRAVPEMNAGFIPDQLDVCHDAKLALRKGPPQDYDYPRYGAIALVHIGDGLLATAPGELTTMTGARVKSAVSKSFPAAPIAIVGLTNHYLQYFATPEEYRFQYYEGASTLYGPNSEPFLTRQFGYLASLLAQKCDHVPATTPPTALPPLVDLPGQDPVNVVHPFDLDHAGPRISRMPPAKEPSAEPPKALEVARVRRHGVWGYEATVPAMPLTFTSDRSRLTVSVVQGDVVKDDDRGASIEVSELDDEAWRVRWSPDLDACDARCGQKYVLRLGGHFHADSKPFTLSCDVPVAGCGP